LRKRRFRTFFGLNPRRDVDAELAFHVDMLTRELIERGESPERARTLALQRFGDRTRPEAECVAIDERRRRRFALGQFAAERWQDVRYTFRMLRRTPGLTAVAVLTLALGIGANVAIFSLFHQVLLRPLPVPAPEELVHLVSPGLRAGASSCSGVGGCAGAFSYPMFRDFERLNTMFTGVAAHRDISVNLRATGETINGTGLLVSGSYFPVLGVRPALGRLIMPEDTARIGGSEVVVVTHAYWQSQLGARPDIVGQPLMVNGQSMTVVGVTPAGFEGTVPGLLPKVFVPITMRWRVWPATNQPADSRRAYWVYVFARLKPGVSMEQARAALDPPYRAIIRDVEVPLQEGLSPENLAQFAARTLQLESGARGQSTLLAEAQPPLLLLLAVTGLVLVIACINVANLVLARVASRSRELATRLSIGASRGRVVAQLLTESTVLACVAAVASLGIAQWTLALIHYVLQEALPITLGAWDILVAAGLAIAAGLATGVYPAVYAARCDSMAVLKTQSGQTGGGRGTSRMRIVLSTAQMAASMVLLVLAGLFTASLANIYRADPGMQTDGIVTFTVAPQRNGYTSERSVAFFDRVEQELALLPGVTMVSASTTPLMAGDNRRTSMRVEGMEGSAEAQDALYDEVGAGYFRTLGIPIVAGREFTATDVAGSPMVAVVNAAFVKQFGLGPNAVGKRMSRGARTLEIEIVGVAADAKHNNLQDAVAPMFFLSARQSERRPGFRAFFVRTSMPEADALPAIRRAVTRLDANLPIEKLQTMSESMRGAARRQRLMGIMTGAFAAIATLVAGIGLYGVVAYGVAQRTPEIGLRMALGATSAGVRWMVLKQVGVIAAIGAGIGLAAALAVGRAARTMLFGLQFHDAAVLAGAIGGLALVTLAAGLVPASRAARVDPMKALKYE
jgi:predicted permease